MKTRVKYVFVLSVIVVVGAVAMSTGRAAPQPLRVNWICGNGVDTGTQSSNQDADVGRVVLHFTVIPGTPNGTYGFSFSVDGLFYGSYSNVVTNGQVETQDWAIVAYRGQTFSFTTPGGIISINGSEHLHIVSGAPNPGFIRINGGHYTCCEYDCSSWTTYDQVIGVVIGEAPSDENQTRECDPNTRCSTCSAEPMASYSIHLMLASLHIEDTPISSNPPRGPSTSFKVTYNQREVNQPTTFTSSNLGPKWTFNWLSYVTDNGPATVSASPTVYVRGGGTEVFGGFDPGTQSYAPDRQTLAVLVRTSKDTYEKRFPNGSKEVFSKRDESIAYSRRIFLTRIVDAAGNSATLTYDGSLRITTITDSLGQSTNLAYGLADDPLKITQVIDPFGRFATFEYRDRKLIRITDPIGIESAFGYASGSDFIESMTTPYGTSTFARGESGNLVRWLEATDPRGGKERVEYNIAAPNIVSTETSAPAGVHNTGLQLRNTFYWDKKAMADAPGDYAKAHLFHWLVTPDGKVSGIKHSEKKALESRIWYTYPDQNDPAKVGSKALPTRIARILDGGVTQLSRSSYNEIGNLLTETDPLGRVTSYLYDTNGVDVLEVYQRNPTGASLDPEGQRADKVAAYTYNSLHERLTETDSARQVTTYTYDTFGQMLTRMNAKNETTTYDYGGIAPAGYRASITSPPFNGVSAVTTFGYDSCKRVRTVTNGADQYTVTTDYDNLDRKITVTYPDTTYEQFQYTDNVTGQMTLDLTGSRDRLGRWTYRHYDGNRRMDSMTDPSGHATLYGWCTCGSLNSITDSNRNVTTFNRDLQSRVYQKVFADSTTINNLFEGQTAPNTPGATSRLKSSTDALNRRTNYVYTTDNNISQVSYTDSSGNPLNPATPSVAYTFDQNYNRIATMTDGIGLTAYTYYPVNSSPTRGAGELEGIDGPLANDVITFTYEELGRTLSQSIDGVGETAVYDSLGRLTTTRNVLGQFERAYDGVTARLHTLTYPNGQVANYGYYGNDHDRRLQTLQNTSDGGANLSKLDYTYNPEGQMTSWGRLLGTAPSGLWFDYDDARQLMSVRNASDPNLASRRYDYGYDEAGNRMNDSNYDPNQVFSNGWFATYTANAVNQLDNRTVQLNNGAPVSSELIYDLAGNLTDDGQLRTFEWDAANRLTAINHPGNRRSEFSYDGLSRRVQIVEKTGSTVTSTKKFVWIGTGIAQERDANNTITRSYFSEGEQRGDSRLRGSQKYYYTRDHLSSIREVTDNTGAVQARYDYDPYGKRTKLSGKADVDFGYTGHYHHAPTNLNLTLYRAYDSALGRWISRDPIGEEGGLNLYGYAFNNPVNRVDLLGLQSPMPGPVPTPNPGSYGRQTDFHYHGNWGGPGWANGGWMAESGPLPDPGDPTYREPKDREDACYEQHDRCIHACPGCPSRSNGSVRACDHQLAQCLRRVPYLTPRVRLTAWSFNNWIPWLVH